MVMEGTKDTISEQAINGQRHKQIQTETERDIQRERQSQRQTEEESNVHALVDG